MLFMMGVCSNVSSKEEAASAASSGRCRPGGKLGLALDVTMDDCHGTGQNIYLACCVSAVRLWVSAKNFLGLGSLVLFSLCSLLFQTWLLLFAIEVAWFFRSGCVQLSHSLRAANLILMRLPVPLSMSTWFDHKIGNRDRMMSKTHTHTHTYIYMSSESSWNMTVPSLVLCACFPYQLSACSPSPGGSPTNRYHGNSRP